MSISGVITGWVIFILAMEYIMWDIFHHKMAHICLPNEMDLPFLRSFTMGRMGALVILHAIVLSATVAISTVLVW